MSAYKYQYQKSVNIKRNNIEKYQYQKMAAEKKLNVLTFKNERLQFGIKIVQLVRATIRRKFDGYRCHRPRTSG